MPSNYLVYAIFEVPAENEDHAIDLVDGMLMSRVDLPTPDYDPEVFYAGIDMLSTVKLDDGISFRDDSLYSNEEEDEEGCDIEEEGY